MIPKLVSWSVVVQTKARQAGIWGLLLARMFIKGSQQQHIQVYKF